MDILATLEASPVWERFLRHEYTRMFKIPIEEDDDIGKIKNSLKGITSLRESFLLAALVDWLDTEGVHVFPYPKTGAKCGYDTYPINGFGVQTIKRVDIWDCSMFDQFSEMHYNEDWKEEKYPSRSEATKAGIIKAFSLLEKKI